MPADDKLHPGFLELSQTVRLPYNFWATLAIGSFNNSRYGIDFNLIHHFKDERFSIEGRIGYTGTGYWEGFTMHYGTKMRATWSLEGYIPRITPSNNTGMSYNAGNEQYYYKTYRSAPDDNIMKNNSFNPYFIKSELLNF